MANNRAAARSAARLGAVQALYQMDIAQTDLSDVLSEFSSVVRLSGGPDTDEEAVEADTTFLTDIVKGVVDGQRELDPLVDTYLATGWKLRGSTITTTTAPFPSARRKASLRSWS